MVKNILNSHAVECLLKIHMDTRIRMDTVTFP